jgi:hypothetical protein
MYYGHRCPVSFVDYLREFEAIFEKALTSVSGTQGKLFDEKNRGQAVASLITWWLL